MTVLADKVTDVAYARHARAFTITAAQDVRANVDGDGFILAWEHVINVNTDGTFTTPDIDPGPAYVQFYRTGKKYFIDIPDWNDPIELFPLIEDNLQPLPGTNTASFVVNRGGVAAIEKVTQAWFDANPHDPTTFYVII